MLKNENGSTMQYAAMADILAFAFVCCARERQGLLVAVAVQLASVFAIFGYLAKTGLWNGRQRLAAACHHRLAARAAAGGGLASAT